MKYIDGVPVPEVGDRVLVRADLIWQSRYAHKHDARVTNRVTANMHNLAGSYVTISSNSNDPLRGGQYMVNEYCAVYWTSDMFDLSEYEIKPVSVSKDDLMEFIGG